MFLLVACSKSNAEFSSVDKLEYFDGDWGQYDILLDSLFVEHSVWSLNDNGTGKIKPSEYFHSSNELPIYFDYSPSTESFHLLIEREFTNGDSTYVDDSVDFYKVVKKVQDTFICKNYYQYYDVDHQLETDTTIITLIRK